MDSLKLKAISGIGSQPGILQEKGAQGSALLSKMARMNQDLVKQTLLEKRMDMPVIEKIKLMYEDVHDLLKDAREAKKNSEKANTMFQQTFSMLETLHRLILQHHGVKHQRYEDVCV